MFRAASYANRAGDHPVARDTGPTPADPAATGGPAPETGLPALTANEIYFGLHDRGVCYDRATEYLYLADAADGPVVRTLCAALAGLNRAATIEQVYLDPHKCFSGARRVRLIAELADPVLVALRLAGVRTAVR